MVFQTVKNITIASIGLVFRWRSKPAHYAGVKSINMARRKEFKNIAQGVVGSFVSRNNDYDGYWELAKLYDLAENNCGVKISIDLIQPSISPQSEAFRPLVTMWHRKLLKTLESNSIPISWLSSAVVRTSFNVEYVAKLHKWGTYGEPCTCECEIITDSGVKYREVAGTRCMPFSSAWFQRSTRRNNF